MSDDNAAATVAAFTDEQVVSAYMNVRDARAKATAEYEKKDSELRQVLDTFGGELLRRMRDRGNTGFHTNYGDRQVSVYREEDIKPSAENWTEVYAWVLSDALNECAEMAQVPARYRTAMAAAIHSVKAERFELFEKRLKKGTVKEHMEAHATYDEETGHKVLGSPPPGVKVLREWKAAVRLLPSKAK